MSIDTLKIMKDENAKLLLRLHRSDIGNKSRIEELSKKIRCSTDSGSQQRITRKRAISELVKMNHSQYPLKGQLKAEKSLVKPVHLHQMKLQARLLLNMNRLKLLLHLNMNHQFQQHVQASNLLAGKLLHLKSSQQLIDVK